MLTKILLSYRDAIVLDDIQAILCQVRNRLTLDADHGTANLQRWCAFGGRHAPFRYGVHLHIILLQISAMKIVLAAAFLATANAFAPSANKPAFA